MNNRTYLGNGFTIEQYDDELWLLKSGLCCKLATAIRYSETESNAPDFVYVPEVILKVASKWAQEIN